MLWKCISLQDSLNIWKIYKKKIKLTVKKLPFLKVHSRKKLWMKRWVKKQILRFKVKKECCAAVVELCVIWTPLPALRIDLSIKSGFLPRLWVFIMGQCCKITGFPQCFLLFVRPAMETWSGSISETQGFPAERALRNPWRLQPLRQGISAASLRQWRTRTSLWAWKN